MFVSEDQLRQRSFRDIFVNFYVLSNEYTIYLKVIELYLDYVNKFFIVVRILHYNIVNDSSNSLNVNWFFEFIEALKCTKKCEYDSVTTYSSKYLDIINTLIQDDMANNFVSYDEIIKRLLFIINNIISILNYKNMFMMLIDNLYNLSEKYKGDILASSNDNLMQIHNDFYLGIAELIKNNDPFNLFSDNHFYYFANSIKFISNKYILDY